MARPGIHNLFFVVKNLCSVSGFRRLSQYSTTTSAAAEDPTSREGTHFMVDYLINSLGFSRKEAISASTKVSHLKSTKNSDSVLDLFKNYGLDKTQLRNVVSSVPQILLHKVDKTLEPKLRVLQDLGLSGSDLVKLIKKDPCLFNRELDTSITYLRQVLGSDEAVVKAINRSPWLLSSSTSKRMQHNVVLLQNCGLSNEKIGKLMIRNPRGIIQKPEWLEDIIHRVEAELGIPRDSKMFFHGIWALSSVSKSNLEMRFRIFRSFGWSDSDICTIARTGPPCLALSENKIRSGLNFFMKELGYTPAYLSSRVCLLTLSLEKRVKPRNEVLKILKDNKLVNCKLCLYTVVLLSELKFVEKFVLPYKDEIPDLYENYTNFLK